MQIFSTIIRINHYKPLERMRLKTKLKQLYWITGSKLQLSITKKPSLSLYRHIKSNCVILLRIPICKSFRGYYPRSIIIKILMEIYKKENKFHIIPTSLRYNYLLVMVIWDMRLKKLKPEDFISSQELTVFHLNIECISSSSPSLTLAKPLLNIGRPFNLPLFSNLCFPLL